MTASASSRLSNGAKKGDRKESEAAMISVGSRHRNIACKLQRVPQDSSPYDSNKVVVRIVRDCSPQHGPSSTLSYFRHRMTHQTNTFTPQMVLSTKNKRSIQPNSPKEISCSSNQHCSPHGVQTLEGRSQNWRDVHRHQTASSCRFSGRRAAAPEASPAVSNVRTCSAGAAGCWPTRMSVQPR